MACAVPKDASRNCAEYASAAFAAWPVTPYISSRQLLITEVEWLLPIKSQRQDPADASGQRPPPLRDSQSSCEAHQGGQLNLPDLAQPAPLKKADPADAFSGAGSVSLALGSRGGGLEVAWGWLEGGCKVAWGGLLGAYRLPTKWLWGGLPGGHGGRTSGT